MSWAKKIIGYQTTIDLMKDDPILMSNIKNTLIKWVL